ncbi:MAG: hypothetical protein QTN59_05250 [Candidatus Electrothrix communis]|nr:MAG: hypothetical protein QTN59_05250 [Candidatus Electrothrix communis]
MTETDCPEKALVNYMVSPYDPYNDPMVQTHIFRSESDTLCIKANHIVSDAGGLKEYVRLLAFIYRNLERDPEFKPQINLSGRRSYEQVTEFLCLPDKLKILRLSLMNWFDNLYPRKNWAFPSLPSRSTSDRTFLIRRISSDRFRQIKKYAARHGFTINDILTACLFRGLYKIIQPDFNTPLRLGMTVSLRRYLPDRQGEAITNLANLFLLNIGCHVGDTLKETISLVHNEMAIHKRNFLGFNITRKSIFNLKWLPISLARGFHNYVLKLNFFFGPKDIPPWFTNMGLLKRKNIEFGKIETTDAFMTAPIIYAPLLLIGATGFADTVTITVGFCRTSHDEKKLIDLLDAVEKEIGAVSNLLSKKSESYNCVSPDASAACTPVSLSSVRSN